MKYRYYLIILLWCLLMPFSLFSGSQKQNAIVVSLGETKLEDKTAELWYEDGEKAYSREDYLNAFSSFMKAAEHGYVAAQNKLGYCYMKGVGVEKNHEKAIEWYLRAAEQGDNEAQLAIGLAYEHGVVVEKDYEKAVEWYLKAAEQGYVYAQYNAGFCYENGRGVGENIEEALKWYRKAAQQGYEPAQKHLEMLLR